MSPEREDELRTIYPEMFERYKTPFECDDGWFDLLSTCISGIKRCDGTDVGYTKVAQIKEKYGTLRFYTDEATDEVDEIIRQAEVASANTCENCGAPGSMNKTGWLRSVRCDQCRTESAWPQA